jgi:hypothetical protein
VSFAPCLITSSFTKSGRSWQAEVAGPIGGIIEDVTKLTSSQVRKAYEGKDTNLATELTRVGRRYTPGTFFTKLAVDRLLWDNIQTLADPDYRGSFRRMEQRLKEETGQQFWWSPGENVPQRGPNLGAVVSP